MAATPTEPAHDVTVKEVNLAAETIRIMGSEYTKPHEEYEFSNGRKFVRQTSDSYRDFG